MQKKQSCILLLGGPEELARRAKVFCAQRFLIRHSSYYTRQAKELHPAVQKTLQTDRIDFLFNFLSPIIVPKSALKAVRRHAINFHPAPPEWPGVGSASYAIYNGDATFGATAHIMEQRVDRGKIITVIRFPIRATDYCDTLFDRALLYTFKLFCTVLETLREKKMLSFTHETWKRKPITRKAFEQWMTLSLSDPPGVIKKKIRAVRHRKFLGPYLSVYGYRFVLPPRETHAQ